MVKPTFAVVGAQKSATTWLFECLNEHPEIFTPALKEVHYFCRPEDCRLSRRQSGEPWYDELFEPGPYKAWGELTTDYMFFPYIADDLYKYNPEMKIVFLLRNPVDRAYSAYWMWRRHKADLPPFADMLEKEPAFVERGLYHRQIMPYIERFGAERVRIYVYEEIVTQPESFLGDLFSFLGVDPAFRPKSQDQTVGATAEYGKGAGFLVYKVLSPIINLPFILPAWRWLRANTNLRDRLLSLIAKRSESSGYSAISPQDRQQLLERFRAENARLFTLLDRDIPAWNQ